MNNKKSPTVTPNLVEPLVKWEFINSCWELMRQKRPYNSAATVYPNATWFTWDKHGTGGENSSECCIHKAKAIAEDRAYAQGYI